MDIGEEFIPMEKIMIVEDHYLQDHMVLNFLWKSINRMRRYFGLDDMTSASVLAFVLSVLLAIIIFQ